MESFHEIYCIRCGSQKMKSWDELSDEQKFLVERLPASAEFSLDERKKHLFCPRCWNEVEEKKGNVC
jgi:DNA-directed RNA polymerase subunit RPC12/RpoP